MALKLSKLIPRNPPPLWPRFSSPLHSPAVTARVGRVLGIFFTVCFVTGLLSHYQYSPWHWLPEPASPTWGYRLTQGLHVITGICCIPLLLVKLWSVYPKLFAWPPAKSVLQAIERLSIAVFVFSTLLEVFTGLINILDWYPWPWFFTSVHYALAYVVFGSLLLHIAVKLPIIRDGLATRLDEPAKKITGLTRRGLLVSAAAGVGIVAVTTAGGTVTPLQKLALLSPRRADDATESHVPVNRTAKQASGPAVDVPKAVVSPNYRLTFTGPRSYALTVAEIEALPAVDQTFPLACVEGWSVSARWAGPRLLDLVRRAGGNANSFVRLKSIEPDGIYNHSTIFGPQLSQAILATHLNGDRLTLDHGYPVRLIAPDRAGVLNTKWLKTIEISS